MRTVFLFALLLSATVAVTAEEAQAEGTPAPEATEATPTEAPVEELPPLDCKPNELLEKLDSWSVDCVAMWLENLGFPELRGAFTGNKIDGVALKALTMEKLADDYGVSDEDQRKKIYYNLKDALRKDSSSGNTNHYSEVRTERSRHAACANHSPASCLLPCAELTSAALSRACGRCSSGSCPFWASTSGSRSSTTSRLRAR